MMAAAQPRRAISPYARRLARERRIPLDSLRGSGPSGRIVATDILSFSSPASTQPVAAIQASALATTIAMATLHTLLAGFADAETPFDLNDILLRAAGCALDDVPETSQLPGAPIAFETGRRQLLLADIRKQSLAPLRARRLAAEAGDADSASEPACLSLRLLPASDIRPVVMPLLAGRPMRLVVGATPGGATAEALLSFEAAAIDEAKAAEFLSRFKGYLEVPLRLLA